MVRIMRIRTADHRLTAMPSDHPVPALPSPRVLRALIIAACIGSLPACQTGRVLTNRCESPFVAGSATLSVAAGGATRGYELTGEGGRNGSNRFDIVRPALLGDQLPADTGITWALTSPDGARLVVTHRTRLQRGETLTVGGAPGRRDWGIGPAPAAGSAAAALELPNEQAAQLSGTMRVLSVAPLELELSLANASRTVRGMVRFRRASEERPCFS